MEELNLIIADNICTLRSVNSITQSELAEKLNYSDKLVSKWERGEAAPNAYTLKTLSEIFGVGVEFLFTDHRNSSEKPKAAMKQNKFSRRIITEVSLCGIWTLSFLVFIIMWLVYRPLFSIFVYTIPVSAIALLVFNSVWNKGKHNYWIISGLIISIVLALYVALIRFNCWQIFLLLIPAELIILLCAKIKKKQ